MCLHAEATASHPEKKKPDEPPQCPNLPTPTPQFDSPKPRQNTQQRGPNTRETNNIQVCSQMALNGLVFWTWHWLVEWRTNYSKVGLFSLIEHFDIVLCTCKSTSASGHREKSCDWTVNGTLTRILLEWKSKLASLLSPLLDLDIHVWPESNQTVAKLLAKQRGELRRLDWLWHVEKTFDGMETRKDSILQYIFKTNWPTVLFWNSRTSNLMAESLSFFCIWREIHFVGAGIYGSSIPLLLLLGRGPFGPTGPFWTNRALLDQMIAGLFEPLGAQN